MTLDTERARSRESIRKHGTFSPAPKSCIAYIVTTPFSAWRLLAGQLSYFRLLGYEVHLVCSLGDGDLLKMVTEREGVEIHTVAMTREISLLHDLKALRDMIKVLKKINPDIINFSTPKAGLLGGLAGVITNVEHRVYVMRGLRLEGATGWKRRLLTLTEWLSCSCAHHVICISNSLRDRAVELKVVEHAQTRVLGAGSSNGVFAEHFVEATSSKVINDNLRHDLGIATSAPVVGFVGRLTRDKGIEELIKAFLIVQREEPEAHLVLVGEFEKEDPVAESTRREIETSSHIHHLGFVVDPARFYGVMDVLAFPTHREGFGNVALEAAAAGLPVVTTNATGARDSVVHGETGLIVSVGDPTELAEALLILLRDYGLRRRLGASGRARVLAFFTPEEIWKELNKVYESRLPKKDVRKTYFGKRKSVRSHSEAPQREPEQM